MIAKSTPGSNNQMSLDLTKLGIIGFLAFDSLYLLHDY